MTAEQRLIADQIVSVFENDTPELQYGYAENINDGRGITAGRAGFTSATGDLLLVVERYTALRPDNVLSAYLPRLRELAREASAATDGLEGLVAAWGVAAGEAAFRAVQDDVVNEEYFDPAVAHARQLGLRCPLTLLALYDTAIQHGDGDDPDGLPAIIARTTASLGRPAGSRDAETRWLDAFLLHRRAVLLNPSNPATREAWAESIVRVDALRGILTDGNLELVPQIIIAPYGMEHSIPAPR